MIIQYQSFSYKKFKITLLCKDLIYTFDIDVDFDKKSKWIQQSWTVACDYCDINASNKKVYYKIEYKKHGEWVNTRTGSVKNDLVTIRQANSDSLKVYITYKDYDCFNLYFY